MKKEQIEELKEYLLEMDEDIVFNNEYDNILIGYAERFGGELIPLYEGFNTFLYNTPEEVLNQATIYRNDICEFKDLKNYLVGYVSLEDTRIALLYDKEKYLEGLAKEYETDGMEIDEDDSYYSQALQWYEYNVIGTGLSDMTTPAFACTEEFPLPVTSNS